MSHCSLLLPEGFYFRGVFFQLPPLDFVCQGGDCIQEELPPSSPSPAALRGRVRPGGGRVMDIP